jgi:hypothetical protein
MKVLALFLGAFALPVPGLSQTAELTQGQAKLIATAAAKDLKMDISSPKFSLQPEKDKDNPGFYAYSIYWDTPKMLQRSGQVLVNRRTGDAWLWEGCKHFVGGQVLKQQKLLGKSHSSRLLAKKPNCLAD